MPPESKLKLHNNYPSEKMRLLNEPWSHCKKVYFPSLHLCVPSFAARTQHCPSTCSKTQLCSSLCFWHKRGRAEPTLQNNMPCREAFWATLPGGTGTKEVFPTSFLQIRILSLMCLTSCPACIFPVREEHQCHSELRADQPVGLWSETTQIVFKKKSNKEEFP